MSYGEVAFLVLVLAAFGTFIGCVGFISIWSRRPAGDSYSKTAAITPMPKGPVTKKAA